ncbi:uncharacterized protein LOC112588824 [Harpegnathos saltator]|uniref:uncharacterized protein LOC112588824 n=1 Tax=Harpegnathos saltator TaxID=610380 RepID=UPI000DBEEA78|nr:uncharacterized protein LOC112588824 [Harpegnathos saltator]
MKPPQAHLRMGRIRIPIEAQMKYLGLTLDGTWCFREHFSRLIPRLRIISINLGRLMPNIGGPDRKVRRLYAAVVNSVALYGAPIWAEALVISRPSQALLRRVQRTVATRIIRGYRIVSHVVATALAGMPPLELLALMYRSMSKEKLRRTLQAEDSLAESMRRLKHQARQLLFQRWQRRLQDARSPWDITGLLSVRSADGISQDASRLPL